jgi:hypothetical protein
MQLLSKLTSGAVTLALVLLVVGCVTTARLYNLNTGEILNATFENTGSGHGNITLVAEDGRIFTGEYSTISGASFSSGFGSGSVSGSGAYTWATAQGFSFNQPGQQYGSAVVVGDGVVIEVVYIVDPWGGHGNGVGRDNKGGVYRLQF